MLKVKTIYVDYVHYNLWANRRLTEVFSGLPEEIANQHIVSSFPSVKLTILHLWDAEYIWLQRLQGVSPAQFPSKQFQDSTQQAIAMSLETSQAFIDFVESKDDDFFEATLHFKTIAHGSQQATAAEMIHHCMNHSTYHRGQLTVMGRQLGIHPLPATDLIYFLRERKELFI